VSGAKRYWERLKEKHQKPLEPAGDGRDAYRGVVPQSEPRSRDPGVPNAAASRSYPVYDPQKETVDEFEQRVLSYEAQAKDLQKKLDFVRPLLYDNKLLPVSAYQMQREMEKFDITKKEVEGLRSELDTLKGKGGL
jgi:hypothetical protein